MGLDMIDEYSNNPVFCSYQPLVGTQWAMDEQQNVILGITNHLVRLVSFKIISFPGFWETLNLFWNLMYNIYIIHAKYEKILVSMKAQLGFSMPLFLPSFLFCFVCFSNHISSQWSDRGGLRWFLPNFVLCLLWFYLVIWDMTKHFKILYLFALKNANFAIYKGMLTFSRYLIRSFSPHLEPLRNILVTFLKAMNLFAAPSLPIWTPSPPPKKNKNNLGPLCSWAFVETIAYFG